MFWDCDVHEDFHNLNEGDRRPRGTRILNGYQRGLFNFVQKKTEKKLRIWYNVDVTWSNKDRCVHASMIKVRDWFSKGDLPFLESGDCQLHQCVETRCHLGTPDAPAAETLPIFPQGSEV